MEESMVQRLRVVVTVATVAAATLGMSGCSRVSDSAGASGSSQRSTLTQVVSRGELRVADCLSFAPFGFKDKSGAPSGYDVDLAKEAASRLGVKLSIVDTTSDNRIPNLKTNKVDVVFCNFTENTQRAKQISFTDPYVVAGETLLVKKSSGIKTVSDLSGKTVATVKGSTNSTLVKQLNPKADVQEYDTSAAAVLAVKQGQAAAMVEDSNFQAYQAKLDPSLTVAHDSLVPLEYNGFGVRQGDPDWQNWLNLFLREINTDGTNAKLYQKWFGTSPAYKLQPSY
jgi:polar amino acid transport system substrate-binding protein